MSRLSGVAASALSATVSRAAFCPMKVLACSKATWRSKTLCMGMSRWGRRVCRDVVAIEADPPAGRCADGLGRRRLGPTPATAPWHAWRKEAAVAGALSANPAARTKSRGCAVAAAAGLGPAALSRRCPPPNPSPLAVGVWAPGRAASPAPATGVPRRLPPPSPIRASRSACSLSSSAGTSPSACAVELSACCSPVNDVAAGGALEPEGLEHGLALQHQERGEAARHREAPGELDHGGLLRLAPGALQLGDLGRRVEARDEGVAGARSWRAP